MTLVSDGAVVAQLEGIIQQNGEKREQEPDKKGSFDADRILAEENGFELWLGSLEDALCLKGLHHNSINSVLNCALAECQDDVEASRGHEGGRRRSYARGLSESFGSLSEAVGDMNSLNAAAVGTSLSEKVASPGFLTMDRDRIREEIEFNGEWYSRTLQYDVRFFGFAAKDKAGYDMIQHFDSTSAYLKQCRAEGRKVIVHCVMGINRSAATCVAFMVREMKMDLAKAVTMASAARGHILSNRTFVDQLVKLFSGRPETAVAISGTHSFKLQDPLVREATERGCGHWCTSLLSSLAFWRRTPSIDEHKLVHVMPAGSRH